MAAPKMTTANPTSASIGTARAAKSLPFTKAPRSTCSAQVSGIRFVSGWMIGRHRLDREDEAGQHHRRDHDEHHGLLRLVPGPRDQRDQQPEAEAGEHEQEQPGEHHPDAAVERHLEPEQARRRRPAASARSRARRRASACRSGTPSALIGVTNICSSVPDSRSFTTAWLMIAIREIIMIAAIRPGDHRVDRVQRRVEHDPHPGVDSRGCQLDAHRVAALGVELGDDLRRRSRSPLRRSGSPSRRR